MVNESIADTYLRSLANERTRSPLTRDLARCAIEAREETARLRERLAVLERVREAVGGYAQFRKDWEASVRTLRPREAYQHLREWGYLDGAAMAKVLAALDAAKEAGRG